MSDAQDLAYRALQYFRYGFDTFDIAKKLGITEARASRLLWVARSHAKHRPADYLDKNRKVRRIAVKPRSQAA